VNINVIMFPISSRELRPLLILAAKMILTYHFWPIAKNSTRKTPNKRAITAAAQPRGSIADVFMFQASRS